MTVRRRVEICKARRHCCFHSDRLSPKNFHNHGKGFKRALLHGHACHASRKTRRFSTEHKWNGLTEGGESASELNISCCREEHWEKGLWSVCSSTEYWYTNTYTNTYQLRTSRSPGRRDETCAGLAEKGLSGLVLQSRYLTCRVSAAEAERSQASPFRCF